MDVLKQRLSNTRDEISQLKSQLFEKETELHKIISERKTLNSQVMAAHKKQDALEVKLEKVGVDLKTCFARLDESDGATEESRKVASYLEKKRATQESILEDLEKKMAEVNAAAKSTQSRLNDTLQSLRETEERIEQVEALNEKKEKNIRELEQLHALYTNKIKSFKSSEDSAHRGVDSIEAEILEISEKLKAANLRASKAEEEAQQSQVKLAELEDELSDWKEKNEGLRSEIGRISVELE